MRPVSRSIFSMRTRIGWPSCTTSLGCLMRPHDNWLMCNKPSTPLPSSTKAPKSISFRTVPS